MDFRTLQKRCYEIAKSKGWHEEDDVIVDLLNIHSEVTEAWGELIKGREPTEIIMQDVEGWYPKPEGVPIELADIVIRVLDTAEAFGIDLQYAIELKNDYNRTRSYRHGGKRY